MVNAMVWELMPRMRQAAEALLEGSTVVVVLALLLLLAFTASAAFFIHDDSPTALARAMAAALLVGVAGYKAADAYPFTAATCALIALLLFSAWRGLTCTAYYVTTGLATPRGRRAVLISAVLLGGLLNLAYLYRGTTSARWLFLVFCLMLASGSASWVVLPVCTVRTYMGVRAVAGASIAAAAAPKPAEPAGAKLGPAYSTVARVNLFLQLNHRLGGVLRCLLSILLALVLAGLVVLFSTLKLSRDINARIHSGPSMLAATPPPAYFASPSTLFAPPAPPLSPPGALFATAARALSYAKHSHAAS
jgi:hypothetical protein